ncbi:D-2-hydroxyacid dehydrogenase [bacterium]|nr:D-2-hydroxyacid dehydrogenase [bacterium]MCI0606455.1 D-2-hydroxyacid dehydrogenase [bacterium]
MKVLLYSEHWNRFWCLPPELVQWLRTDFPEIEFDHVRTEEQIFDSIPDAEIYFGYRLQKKDVNVAKKLKWIHVPAASVYPLTDLGLQQKGIVVSNSRGLHAVPIAEHVLGCMLVFSRKFLESWQYQQKHYYAAREILTESPLPGELRGKTVLVLGLGGIGSEAARLCKAFGMRVLACKRNPAGTYDNVDQVYAAEDFHKPLPEADYLVIAVPRTSRTDGLIGEVELEMLKKSCVIINIARAKIIRHEALIRCLKENRIRGAALDVFEQEPLPPDSELFSLPNVFITPHTSGVSAMEHWPRMMELFAENLRRWIAGQPLMNIVDLAEGY